MNARRSATAAVVLACAGVALSGSGAGAQHARPVSLSEARTPPERIVYVDAGDGWDLERQCGRDGYYAEVSAYGWNGGALGGQAWTRDDLVTYWRDPRGGRVVFDGVRVVNRTRRPILFAGWC